MLSTIFLFSLAMFSNSVAILRSSMTAYILNLVALFLSLGVVHAMFNPPRGRPLAKRRWKKVSERPNYELHKEHCRLMIYKKRKEMREMRSKNHIEWKEYAEMLESVDWPF